MIQMCTLKESTDLSVLKGKYLLCEPNVYLAKIFHQATGSL